MFCRNCGASVDDHAQFCPNCGTSITESIPNVPETVPNPQPVVEQPVNDNGFSLTLMIFAIVGVSFGCNPYTSVIGIVFSAIARGMYRKFINAGYQVGGQNLTGKAKVSGIFAKVGQIVSLVGIILSIAMLVLLVILICVLVATETHSYRYY